LAIQISALFSPAQLTNAAATYYTVSASTTLYHGRIRFTNTDTNTRTVTAYAVPASSAAAPSNCFLNAEGIAPNSHLDIDLPVMGPGAFLQALASANGVVTITQIDGVLSS
jgi:hypothetical protein